MQVCHCEIFKSPLKHKYKSQDILLYEKRLAKVFITTGFSTKYKQHSYHIFKTLWLKLQNFQRSLNFPNFTKAESGQPVFYTVKMVSRILSENLTKHYIANIPFVHMIKQNYSLWGLWNLIGYYDVNLWKSIRGFSRALTQFMQIISMIQNITVENSTYQQQSNDLNGKQLLSKKKILLSVTIFESEVIWRWDNAKISHFQCEWICFYGADALQAV